MRYVAVSNLAYDRLKESGGLAEHQSHPMLDKQFRLLMTDNPAASRQSAVRETTNIPNALGFAVEVAHGGLSGLPRSARVTGQHRSSGLACDPSLLTAPVPRSLPQGLAGGRAWNQRAQRLADRAGPTCGLGLGAPAASSRR